MKKTRNHAQMFVIAVVGVILFLPLTTFASTTTTPNTSPAYIAQLEAELKVVEAELAAILATQSTAIVPTTDSATPPTQVAVSNAQSSQSNGVGTYNFAFQVTNTASTTLYVPLTTNTNSTGTAGFIYDIQGANYSGEQSATTTCPTTITLSTGWNTTNGIESQTHTNFCVIPAGQTAEIDVAVGLQPTISGNYSVQFTSMNYTFNGQPNSSITYQNIPLGNTANTNPVYITSSTLTDTATSNTQTSGCAITNGHYSCI